MENRINIAKLLKDCPKGMELDCTMFDDVTLLEVTDSRFPIKIAIGDNRYRYLTETGGYANDIIPESKCVIFPKGKITWEGFVPPCKFKDGDVVAIDTAVGAQVFIFKEFINTKTDYACCHVMLDDDGAIDFECGNYYVERFATEEEKERLFKAIKDNGYKWNSGTKTLEKLVPNKFDITTLIPFESRVLVRNDEYDKWLPAVWGFYDKDEEWPYNCSGFYYCQCIPYEGNKHLLGKTDDCEDFYKTWE